MVYNSKHCDIGETEMTNEEKLKGLSAEELARFIADIADCATCNNFVKYRGNDGLKAR